MNIRTLHRPHRAALVVASLALLSGCTEMIESAAPTGPSVVTAPSAPDAVLTPVQDVFAELPDSSTAARTILVVDGKDLPAHGARCSRTVDEASQRSVIRLTVENEYRQPLALVVLSDDDRLSVLSAIVFRGDGAALTGVEGQDGSTLTARGDNASFTVAGSVRDEADGTEHLVELLATCDVS